MSSEMTIVRRAAVMALKGIRLALAASSIRPADRRAAEIYLLVTLCGASQPLAATVCGCTKQNVSKLLREVENRRDDALLDGELARLEAGMGVM